MKKLVYIKRVYLCIKTPLYKDFGRWAGGPVAGGPVAGGPVAGGRARGRWIGPVAGKATNAVRIPSGRGPYSRAYGESKADHF